MKIKLIALSIIVIFNIQCSAQTPQIALVRPSNNSTQIFTSLQSAYNSALDDDIIYLPGGTFTIQDSIKKKLNFIGAGFFMDSCLTTGVTILSKTVLYIDSAGSGTTFEGLYINLQYNEFNPNGFHGGNNQFSLINCKLSGGTIKSGNNCIIKNCIILGDITNVNNCLISNCILKRLGIQLNQNGATNSTIKNCIFTTQVGGYCVSNSTNSIFQNNIFGSNSIQYNSATSTFSNSIKYNPNTPQANEYNSILVDSIPQIFVSNMNTITINENYNYQLKPTCPGNNAGTDGTDVGIFGTAYPVKTGWVPSNPHMYFKQVAAETTPDGKLQIHYKVRSGNY